MGNCNGDVSDDFILPNGTLLSSNSTERQILEQFVRQFQVTSDTTIFTYEEGEGYTDFIDKEFVPYFGDELDMEVSSAAIELCGAYDYACIFDYAVTGDQNFAKNTKASKSENEVIVSNLENQTPVIKSLTGSTIRNKRWTVTMEQENNLQIIAMDSDGDELSYLTDENSTNISVDNDGQITFTPTDYNLLLLQIRVKDSKSGYSSAEFVSLVYCTNCSGHGICNNMTASVVKNKLLCDCYPAYTGEECEEEIDACESLPCQDGRTCTDLTAAEQGYNTIGFKCGPCQIGFHDGPLDTCQDIDECENEKVCDQTCTNTYGSFLCTCDSGYRLDQRDGITCIDVNECEERTAVCQQNCENIEGSYNCFCYDGYSLNDDQSTCTLDINECAQGNMPCSQNCTNTDGHFKCSCYAGYQLAEDGTTCSSCESSYFGEDCKNMCECNIHGVCDPVQGCICETGWFGVNCDEDVDECLQADSCPDGQVCENQRGTFHCVCPEGLRKEDGACIDIDECVETEFRTACNFEANEICINTRGSYSCGCRKGFTRNTLSICEDINECLIGIDGCEQLCDNVAGGYNCKCYPGYRKAEDRHQCVDVKELCKNQNLDCSHGCSIDNNGIPVCFCPRGYHLHGSNRCEDINECADLSENLCSFKQGCLNINGSHVCSCPAGQRLENDNRTCHECDESTWGDNCTNDCLCGQGSTRCDPVMGCICQSGFTGQFCSEDINECATGQLICPDNEVCVNLPGSSRCQCREGYYKKNEICTDVNECDDKQLHNCKQVCTNSLGSFNCSCYPGYAHNDLTNTCTDINECDLNLNLCNEICTNTEGSYRCSCTSGLPLQPDGITCEVKMCLANECPQHLECRSQKSTYECVCFNGLKPNSDLQCEDCNRILNENSGKIMTSFYPQNYSEDSNCSWTIHLNETNAIISLTIDQYEVEGYPYDYLVIYDGPNADAETIGGYWDEAPGTVKSTGNSMHIVFYSDSSENRNGFIGSYVADSQCKHKNCSHRCKVKSTKPWTEECLCSEWMKLDETGTLCLEIHACNTTINESSGYIVSPGYPKNYPDATYCHWTIEAAENEVITLSFEAFALEGGVDCPYDYVQVLEGISSNASQLGLYCGGEVPLNLTSTSEKMHLIFRSDNAANSGGFKAEFFIK
ncbi:unnamed protein product [Lymnaea stagnalis]|uniref:Uncharacterized protein n=1 Tax=Lymnaea stagnalis TaxID=6523 RepID=A0AAV2H9H8_LYMST